MLGKFSYSNRQSSGSPRNPQLQHLQHQKSSSLSSLPSNIRSSAKTRSRSNSQTHTTRPTSFDKASTNVNGNYREKPLTSVLPPLGECSNSELETVPGLPRFQQNVESNSPKASYASNTPIQSKVSTPSPPPHSNTTSSLSFQSPSVATGNRRKRSNSNTIAMKKAQTEISVSDSNSRRIVNKAGTALSDGENPSQTATPLPKRTGYDGTSDDYGSFVSKDSSEERTMLPSVNEEQGELEDWSIKTDTENGDLGQRPSSAQLAEQYQSSDFGNYNCTLHFYIFFLFLFFFCVS